MNSSRPRYAHVLLAALAAPLPATFACQMHEILGLTAPTVGIWPSAAAPALNVFAAAAEPGLAPADPAPSVTDPAITSWKFNTTGAKAFSPAQNINALVSNINADVATVAYNAANVYVKTSGVPSHAVGPFPGNPAYPADQNRTARIPRNPQVQNGNKTNVGLGNVGIMVNGVSFFDSRDAMSYNNQNVWHQSANYFEASSFDAGKGHPAPGQGGMPQPGQLVAGNYHYHQAPVALLNQLDPANTGQHHSPLIGFAFDGFPVYGPFGYANPDGSGGVVRETSSYQLRNITTRTTLPNGNALQPSQYGPAVSAQYPLGAYTEDYAYIPGSGSLDQYNGRFTVTPEYPQGTYAYFLSTDATGAGVYPYIVGPQYYGVVDTANTGPGGTIAVPADVTFYSPIPEPAVASLLAPGVSATLMGRPRRRK